MNKLLVLITVLLLAGSAAWAGKHDDRGYMGVTLSIVNNEGEGEHENGVWVSQVMPGSGADEAGIRAHDRIVAIDGGSVVTLAELHSTLDGARPDETITVTVLRDGRSQDVTLTLGRHPVAEELRFGVVVDEKQVYFGVQVEPLKPQLANYFGVEGGLLITNVVEDGPAYLAGVEAGDVVLEVENHSITDRHTLKQAMTGVAPGDEVTVRISRRGTPMTLYVEAGSRDERTMTLEELRLHPDGNVEIIIPYGDRDLRTIHEHKVLIRKLEEKDED